MRDYKKVARLTAVLFALVAPFVAGCKGEEQATGPGGTKLPEHMNQSERVQAIKNNPNYSDAEKEQAIKNLEAIEQMKKGGSTAPPPGYTP